MHNDTHLWLYSDMCYLISPLSAPVDTLVEGPVIADGDQSVTVVLASVFSILVILCFCILLFIMRKKLVNCLHYAPVRPRSYPLASGKFGALNNVFHCFQKVVFISLSFSPPEWVGCPIFYPKLLSLIYINSIKAGFHCTNNTVHLEICCALTKCFGIDVHKCL
jgi:hypothetical protein